MPQPPYLSIEGFKPIHTDEEPSTKCYVPDCCMGGNFSGQDSPYQANVNINALPEDGVAGNLCHFYISAAVGKYRADYLGVVQRYVWKIFRECKNVLRDVDNVGVWKAGRCCKYDRTFEGLTIDFVQEEGDEFAALFVVDELDGQVREHLVRCVILGCPASCDSCMDECMAVELSGYENYVPLMTSGYTDGSGGTNITMLASTSVNFPVTIGRNSSGDCIKVAYPVTLAAWTPELGSHLNGQHLLRKSNYVTYDAGTSQYQLVCRYSKTFQFWVQEPNRVLFSFGLYGQTNPPVVSPGHRYLMTVSIVLVPVGGPTSRGAFAGPGYFRWEAFVDVSSSGQSVRGAKFRSADDNDPPPCPEDIPLLLNHLQPTSVDSFYFGNYGVSVDTFNNWTNNDRLNWDPPGRYKSLRDVNLNYSDDRDCQLCGVPLEDYCTFHGITYIQQRGLPSPGSLPTFEILGPTEQDCPPPDPPQPPTPEPPEPPLPVCNCSTIAIQHELEVEAFDSWEAADIDRETACAFGEANEEYPCPLGYKILKVRLEAYSTAKYGCVQPLPIQSIAASGLVGSYSVCYEKVTVINVPPGQGQLGADGNYTRVLLEGVYKVCNKAVCPTEFELQAPITEDELQWIISTGPVGASGGACIKRVRFPCFPSATVEQCCTDPDNQIGINFGYGAPTIPGLYPPTIGGMGYCGTWCGPANLAPGEPDFYTHSTVQTWVRIEVEISPTSEEPVCCSMVFTADALASGVYGAKICSDIIEEPADAENPCRRAFWVCVAWWRYLFTPVTGSVAIRVGVNVGGSVLNPDPENPNPTEVLRVCSKAQTVYLVGGNA